MSTIQFPTRATTNDRDQVAPLGEPVGARPCRGHHAVIVDDTCLWCGRLPKRTIRETWARRARQIERQRA